MSADIVKQNLLLDVTSSTASTIFAENSGIWNSATEVPRYLYTCLKDLLSLSTVPFASSIIADYGAAQTLASASIVLQPSELIEATDADYARSDSLGSEYAEIDVLVKNVRTSFDFMLMRDIGLRVRYILDYGLRSLPNNQFCLASGSGQGLTVTSTMDNSISPNDFFILRWKNSGILHVSEQRHTFCVEYRRLFV